MNLVKEYFKKETEGYKFNQFRTFKIFYMLFIPTCILVGTVKLLTKGVSSSLTVYALGLIGFLMIYFIDNNYKS